MSFLTRHGVDGGYSHKKHEEPLLPSAAPIEPSNYPPLPPSEQAPVPHWRRNADERYNNRMFRRLWVAVAVVLAVAIVAFFFPLNMSMITGGGGGGTGGSGGGTTAPPTTATFPPTMPGGVPTPSPTSPMMTTPPMNFSLSCLVEDGDMNTQVCVNADNTVTIFQDGTLKQTLFSNGGDQRGTGVASTGDDSHASGVDTTANAEAAWAHGYAGLSGTLEATAQGAWAFGWAQQDGVLRAGAFGSHTQGMVDTAGRMETTMPGAHVEGCAVNNAVVEGIEKGAHAEGYADGSGAIIRAGGLGAHAEGYVSAGYTLEATGDGSHAEGYATRALGNYAHSEGYGAGSISVSTCVFEYPSIPAPGYPKLGVSAGDASHTEGFLNSATGRGGHSEGEQSVSQGIASHAEGRCSWSVGDYSHAEGGATDDTGMADIFCGTGFVHSGSYAIGEGAHAEGACGEAVGFGSHTEGTGCKSIGAGSHTEGVQSQSVGAGSHTEGFLSISDAEYAHVEGRSSHASDSARGAHVGGIAAEAYMPGSWVHGYPERTSSESSQTSKSISQSVRTATSVLTSSAFDTFAGGACSGIPITSGATFIPGLSTKGSLYAGRLTVMAATLDHIEEDPAFVAMYDVVTKTDPSGSPSTSLLRHLAVVPGYPVTLGTWTLPPSVTLTLGSAVITVDGYGSPCNATEIGNGIRRTHWVFQWDLTELALSLPPLPLFAPL